MKRVPSSTQMQEALREDLAAGFAGHPLRQVGLEDEVSSVLGRGHYERARGEATGYRHGYGHHTLKTEAGALPLRPPKVRDMLTPVSVTLPNELRRMTPEFGTLNRRSNVRGLSTRDVEGLYAEVFGGRVSKSTASRARQALKAEFDTWRTRHLSALKILYLFLDGQFQAVRAESAEKEGILAAYVLCEDVTVVLLHLGLGPRVSTDAWVAFLHDLTARGLGTPLLVITDGNPGLVLAVKQVLPGVRRQRCQVHKLRNILAKLSKLAATQLRPLLQQVFLAPDHPTGLRRGRALLARFRARYPSAMECLENELDECLTYLLYSKEHQRLLRTTKLLERTFEESRRRIKVVPRFPRQRSCLTLMYATLMTASRTWRGIPMTPKILRALDQLRAATPETG